jgi:hypothetical protein
MDISMQHQQGMVSAASQDGNQTSIGAATLFLKSSKTIYPELMTEPFMVVSDGGAGMTGLMYITGRFGI